VDTPVSATQPEGRGRSAVERRAWDEAFDAFAVADARGLLGADDLERLATAAYLLGRVDAAVDALARAFEAHRDAGGVQAAVRCGFWVVFMLLAREDAAQAGGWLARCRHLVADLPDDAAEHGYLRCLEAFRQLAVERDHVAALRTAREVVALARRATDDDLVALGLTLCGRAAIFDGRARDGLADLDEAMAAVTAGTLSPPVAGTVYCSLIEACEQIGDVRRAREWTDALTRWCDRQHGMVTFTGQCLTHRATILRRAGSWEEAEQQARLACERFAGAADETATGMARYEVAEVLRVRGDLDAAATAYRDAGAWGHDPQPGLALLRLAQGRADAAAAALRRLLAERTDPVERVELLPAHVEVLLAAGDLGAAERAGAELADHAATFGTDALGAAADQARGALLLARGDPLAAVADLRHALDTWRALDLPYDVARVRVLLAEACEQIGDVDSAEVERTAARRTFTQLGAASDLARLAGAGAAAGHGLSPREHEVLRLVATGATNQAIADELHLAVKTVDRHVGNILAKLGVTSRTAATAYAYEHHLL
jgi:DNA-binding CsgD family transcriptional regulator